MPHGEPQYQRSWRTWWSGSWRQTRQAWWPDHRPRPQRQAVTPPTPHMPFSSHSPPTPPATWLFLQFLFNHIPLTAGPLHGSFPLPGYLLPSSLGWLHSSSGSQLQPGFLNPMNTLRWITVLRAIPALPGVYQRPWPPPARRSQHPSPSPTNINVSRCCQVSPGGRPGPESLEEATPSGSTLPSICPSSEVSMVHVPSSSLPLAGGG